MGTFAAALGTGAGVSAVGTAASAGSFLGMSAATWSTLATAGSIFSTLRAGQQQKSAYRLQAEREEFAARDREIQRRKRLVASLASQNAHWGASGVRAFEGSPANLRDSDLEEFEYDQDMAAANLSMSQQSLLMSGSYAQQSSLYSAGTSLLEYGTRRARRG